MFVFAVFLLDDPLSAVDAHVGAALFTNCIIKALKERRKGVILGKMFCFQTTLYLNFSTC